MKTEELTPEQKFQEKMVERMRENIGDLMPDDVLRGIIEKAMQKIFFEETVIHGQYGNKTQEPPWINKIIKECVETQVDELLTEWMIENEGKVETMIKDLMSEGMGSMVMRAFNIMFQEQMHGMEQQMIQRVKSL